MRVFQFGFGRDSTRFHRPRSYRPLCVAYAGTHDNDTLIGWLYDRSPGNVRTWLKRLGVRWYTGCLFGDRNRLRWSVLCALYRSRAGWVVVPMQDILGTGKEGRMNTPGTARKNWEWRMGRGHVHPSIVTELKSMSRRTGRS
jgi:4-alpha-glucanotransferase